jgi:Transglutaminase-like superfamily
LPESGNSPEPAALNAIACCQRAARWYPGRAACLENSLAAFIALVLHGHRADWCIGRPDLALHAIIQGEPGPGRVTTIDDQVARAARAVPRGHYVAHPRLGSVPQATAQAGTAIP